MRLSARAALRGIGWKTGLQPGSPLFLGVGQTSMKSPFGSEAFGIAKSEAVMSTIRNGFMCGTIRFAMDWLRMRMSGRFRGRSIFCPDTGDVSKYTLGDDCAWRRSWEPLAATLHRASHIIKRLPSRVWAMLARGDVPGSRLLQRYRASHITKRLPSRRWAMAALGDVLSRRAEFFALPIAHTPIRHITSPALVGPITRRTEDLSARGPTTETSLIDRNRCHVGFSRMLRAP
jgi:hypothetical protein